jgi:cytochrome c-type biogenesis protein CcmH/NrfG
MQADQQNFTEGAKWFKQAVAADSKNIDLRNYLEEALFQANNFDEPLSVFRETPLTNRTHPEALFDYE